MFCYMAKERLFWVVLTSSGDPFKSRAFFFRVVTEEKNSETCYCWPGRRQTAMLWSPNGEKWSPAADSGPQMTAREKQESQSYNLRESNLAKNLNVLRSGFFPQRLQKGTQPGWHLDSSRPWAENPATLCWYLWPTELWAHKCVLH